MIELEPVKIPSSGAFPFILVTDSKGEKGLIRAYKDAFSHSKIFEKLFEEVKSTGRGLGYTPEISGGRIEIDPERKCIYIGGNSTTFGTADFKITRRLLEPYINKQYPGYEIVESFLI